MDIPPHAKKVFEGIVFDVWHYDQEMYDGSTATFERLTRPDYVSVIPIIDGKIALAREQQPDTPLLWSLFGGRIDEGEDSLTAAKRELLEEAGLESDDWQVEHVHEFGGKITAKAHVFIARNCKKVADQKLDAGEQIEVHLVSWDEFLAIVTREDFRVAEFALKVLRWQVTDVAKLEAFRKKLFLE